MIVSLVSACIIAYILLTHAGHFYSAIVVLGTPGTLKLPELGLEMEVNPGDVVFFLANQQLHRLTVDGADPQARQVVLTLWTDKNSKDFAQAARPPTSSNPLQARVARSRRIVSRAHWGYPMQVRHRCPALMSLMQH
jgi:hypothetical protein